MVLYSSSSHRIYNLGYHIVFCPEYRRKVLVDGIEERLKELFNEKANEPGITIVNTCVFFTKKNTIVVTLSSVFWIYYLNTNFINQF